MTSVVEQAHPPSSTVIHRNSQATHFKKQLCHNPYWFIILQTEEKRIKKKKKGMQFALLSMKYIDRIPVYNIYIPFQ